MKKIIAIALSMVTILLLCELSSAKPIDHSKSSDFHDVITKPVSGLLDHELDFTVPNYVDLNTPDFADTVAPADDKKISSDFNSDESNQSIPAPIPGKTESASSKPGFEKPKHLPTNLEPLGSENQGSSVTDLEPDSWTAGTSITTLEPVSKGGGTGSLVTSLESGSGEADNFMTTLESGSSSSTVNFGSGESGSSTTTSESDSAGRRDNSAITSKPESHRRNNESTDLPVIGERKNGASDIRSSHLMVLLGIFLIVGKQVT